MAKKIILKYLIHKLTWKLYLLSVLLLIISNNYLISSTKLHLIRSLKHNALQTPSNS